MKFLLLNGKTAAMKLIYVHILQDENQKTEMDNDLRELSFYSVSNEDKICVEW